MFKWPHRSVSNKLSLKIKGGGGIVNFPSSHEHQHIIMKMMMQLTEHDAEHMTFQICNSGECLQVTVNVAGHQNAISL